MQNGRVVFGAIPPHTAVIAAKIKGPVRRSAKFWIWPHEETETNMYTGKHAHLRPLQPAFIMADTGETVTYRELEARTNRLAHLLRNRGLKRLDHYSIFMENNSRYLECLRRRRTLGPLLTPASTPT